MSFFLIKLRYSFFVICAVVTFSFFLIHMIPGDPVDIMLGDSAELADKTALEKELKLNLPLFTQFKIYIHNLLNFNLGYSLFSKRSVSQLIMDHLPATLELSFFTLLFSCLIGIPLGVFSAQKKGKFWDHFLRAQSLTGLSLPSFWLAPLLIYLFSIQLNWLPVSERGTWGHLILPVLTLSSGILALIMQMTRTSMLNELNQDYIRSVRAKGQSSFFIFYIHGLSNAIFPLLTIIGMILGSLLTGTVIVETIFDWPGLGRLLFESIQNRDYPVVQGCVLFISITYIVVNFLTDIGYQFFNPKVKLQ